MAEDVDRGLSHRDYARFAAMSADALEAECTFDAFKAHGPGGQGVNTTDSAVRACHVPTGIVVVSRESRSQYRNRKLCITKLRAELERRAAVPVVRLATKPTLASKRKRLDAKHARSQIKESRRRIRSDE